MLEKTQTAEELRASASAGATLATGLTAKQMDAFLAEHGPNMFDPFGRPDSAGIAVFLKGDRAHIRCAVRKKDLRYKPEELVRQHILRALQEELGYSVNQMAVEVGVVMGSTEHEKPADIVVYSDSTKATERIIVELKRPNRRDGVEQLKSYMNATGTPFGWWTNGADDQFLLRTDPNVFSWRLTRVPAAGEDLSDIDAPLTKADLKPVVDLVDLLEACENEILAHQSVDTFDELFKVVYAKLYDERMNLAAPTDVCQFRIGITEEKAAAAKRLRGLYDRARKKWKGVFKDDIELSDDNLAFVLAALQEYEFIGEKSGDVLGLAFEAMINPQTKGDKGQYFTPRHVVEMCVQMVRPGLDEKVLDPAVGSAGFLIHAMKYVNQMIDAR